MLASEPVRQTEKFSPNDRICVRNLKRDGRRGDEDPASSRHVKTNLRSLHLRQLCPFLGEIEFTSRSAGRGLSIIVIQLLKPSSATAVAAKDSATDRA